jgi:AbrB family looped-hinge helix DNA binding protein
LPPPPVGLTISLKGKTYPTRRAVGSVYKVRVSSKGQIVLPAQIRKKYGIKTGSDLAIVEWAGTLYLVPEPEEDPLDELSGMLAGSSFTTEDFLAERRRERDRDEEEVRRWQQSSSTRNRSSR